MEDLGRDSGREAGSALEGEDPAAPLLGSELSVVTGVQLGAQARNAKAGIPLSPDSRAAVLCPSMRLAVCSPQSLS